MDLDPPNLPESSSYFQIPKDNEHSWNLPAREGTPNAINDLKTRLREAKKWLQLHPREKQTTACSVFKLHPKTLSSHLIRKSTGQQHGGQNKILQAYQVSALHTFICHLVGNYLQPTFQLLYNVICTIKRGSALNPLPPSISWFSKWWKASGLHYVKTKPLARVRITAQVEKEVREWFKDYNRTIRKYKIKRRDIINFDKAGFQIGYPRGQQILIPEHISEVNLTAPTCRFYTDFPTI
jgi:hypothetical protein